ncbi:MAG: YceI family protein [Chitinophagaceae bacterium]
MKKIFVTCLLFLLLAGMTSAQIWYTKVAAIGFDATAPASPERIEGKNRSATCVLDSKTGAIQFSVLMKGFAFERALMEEHFNENYVESNKYPKAEFKGKVKDMEDIDLSKDGNYTVKVKGDLSLHGETREVETTGQIRATGGKVSATAAFIIKLSAFNISIPGLVADKVGKEARISVDCTLEILKK